MRSDTRRASIGFLLIAGVTLVCPGAADAQRRGPSRGAVVRRPAIHVSAARVPIVRRPVYRSFVFAGAFGYPRYWPSAWFGPGYGFYDPWFGFYDPWYQYPYGPYRMGRYPYYGYRLDETSDLRIDAEPEDAEVYVDGYLAGRVDDFDGIFQRLHLRPGEHELVLYLNGYRTIRERLYLNPRSTKTLRFQMERLGPGESAERPPAPVERTEPARTPDVPEPRQRRPYGRGEPRPSPPAPTQPAPEARFGTLSLRVQPADAEILIDGERWSATSGENRISIQLSPGRHRLEIRKDGYERYAEEIGIREAATLALNVSLKKGTH